MTAPSLLDELEGVMRRITDDAAEVRRTGGDPERERHTQRIAVNFIRAHHAELAGMAKRLEAAERDAARYQWLRNQAIAGVMTTPCHGSLNCDEPESEWDAWIDAAAQEGEG